RDQRGAIEDEITQRIRDWAAVIKVERLDTMRMRANHKINSVVHQPSGEFALFVSDIRSVFNSPVDHANHEACVRTSTGDRVAQADSIGCCCGFRSCGRADVTDRYERDFLSIAHREETRRASVSGWCAEPCGPNPLTG